MSNHLVQGNRLHYGYMKQMSVEANYV